MNKPSNNPMPRAVRYLFFTFAISVCLTTLVISQALFQANLFDYRFGLTALGIAALGLVSGLAVGDRTTNILSRWDSVTLIAAAGVSAAVTTSLLVVIPFGRIATYLSAVVLSVAPFFLCAAGMAKLRANGNQGFSLQRYWVALVGAIVSAYLTVWLLAIAGPLQLAWWAAAALSLLALTMNRRLETIVLSGISLTILGLFGFYMAWDFSTPPHWINDEKNPAKQYYMGAAAEGQPTRLATYWNTFTRTDIATDATGDKDWKWVFTNGMFTGAAPADQPGTDDAGQLEKKFPLIALPLATGKPRNILVINSGAGLVSSLAAAAGVSHIRDLESNSAVKNVMEERPGYHSGLSGQPGITLEYGKVRNKLRHDGTRYDQVYLTLPQKQASGWTELGPAENYLYTKEAFREYWSHLEPGGMLVVLSGNELLYMRTILTTWEILKEDKADGGDFLVRRAWGYRAVSTAPLSSPYQYMFMLVKGRVPDDLAARVHGSADSMMVVSLFGPDMTPPSGTINIYYQPYYILYHPLGLEIAHKALHDYASRSLQAPAALAAATDMRPFFFEVVRDMHPFLKWLMAVCLTLLAYVFLVPLPSERRLDSPVAAARPPLPVHLGYFLSLGLATTLTVTAVFHQSVLLTGDSGSSLTGLLTGTGIGMVTGLTVLRGKGRDALEQQWVWTAMAAAVFSALLSWLIPLTGISEWPAVLQTISVGGLAFPAGAFAAMLLIPGPQFLARNLPALTPWSWQTFGAAIVVGVISALWIGQYWGFRLVWLTSASCYLLALGIGLWLHWSELRCVKQATKAEKSGAVPAG